MALIIPTRLVGDVDPAADMNATVSEVNRIGAIVDGPVATLIGGVDLTVGRVLGMKDVGTPPVANPVSALSLYSDAGALRYRNPGGDVVPLDGPAPEIKPGDQGLACWGFDPAAVSGTTQTTSGTIYLARLPVRKTTSITKVWVGVGTAAAGVTSGQTLAGLVSPAGVVLSSAGAATAVGATGPQSVTLGAAQSCVPGLYWVALLVVATTMPFMLRGASPAAVGNANLAAAAYRFAVNGTAQTALPGSFTLGSNSQTNAVSLWVAAS